MSTSCVVSWNNNSILPLRASASISIYLQC